MASTVRCTRRRAYQSPRARYGNYNGLNPPDVSVTNADDDLPPEVTGSVPSTAGPTNASSLTFAVTFTRLVSNVDENDFQLTETGTASGTIAGVTPSSGTTFTVPTASTSAVMPDPRNTAAGVVTVIFNEPVTEVDSGDLSLTWNSAVVSLLASDASTAFVVYPWQNVRNVHDVNDDSDVTPSDVLAIINEINATGVVPISLPAGKPPLVDAVDCVFEQEGGWLTPLPALR